MCIQHFFVLVSGSPRSGQTVIYFTMCPPRFFKYPPDPIYTVDTSNPVCFSICLGLWWFRSSILYSFQHESSVHVFLDYYLIMPFLNDFRWDFVLILRYTCLLLAYKSSWLFFYIDLVICDLDNSPILGIVLKFFGHILLQTIMSSANKDSLFSSFLIYTHLFYFLALLHRW